MSTTPTPCSKCGSSDEYKYFDKVEGKWCEECGGKISDAGFACQRCLVCLHRSCAFKRPRHYLFHEIMHPFHPKHPLGLRRYDEDFICDKCLYISSSGYVYICYPCDFILDMACASSANADLPKLQELLRFKDGKKNTIQHYSHRHKMNLFKYRKIHKQDLYCFWCEKHLSGVCYGCLYSWCKLYLHQACIDKIQRELYHPFHPIPGHLLRLSYSLEITSCNACKTVIYDGNVRYKCDKCRFQLDMDCAKRLPAIKLACHPHLLAYFRDSGSNFCCRSCGKGCGEASICRCLQCDISFHMECVVASEAKLRYHRHPLMLVDSVKEDDSDEFCCDVCEKERDPKHPVYYCQSCAFIAHIQCVLPLPQDQISSSMENEEALSEKKMEQNEGTNATHNLVPLIIHRHRMYKVNEEWKGKKYCNGCRLVINGASYLCKQCRGGFYLHEECGKLAYQIHHPFHSTHPLNLYTSALPWISSPIVCDECRYICRGFIYLCEQCNFKLDVKCAALTTHKTGVSQEKKTDRVTELHHFSHSHKLVLAYCNDPIDKTICKLCELPILGPTYLCPKQSCSFIIHECCLGLPRKIQVPFHLNHAMVLGKTQYDSKQQCYACPLRLKPLAFAYSCEDCQLKLHPTCANSLKRPLKCDSHLDDLFYFGSDYKLLSANYSYVELETHFVCKKCDKSCKGEPFYRCLQCSINFHLKCVPIPDIVESKYHRHPLTLKDSFVEDDDSEKYYCDFCEEERNPRDHVYYCKECNGQTIAHIECLLRREVEDVSCEEGLQKKRREGLQSHPIHLENLPDMVIGVWTNDTNLQLKTTTQFRELLSVEKSPPIEQVIEAGVVPRFVEFLEREDFPQLQFEAAWALTNIASGTSENVKVVIDHGAVPLFVKLLTSPSDDVLELSIWALGNVVGDSPATRDVVLGHGALLPLLVHLNGHPKLSVLRIATWTLSNLFRGKPEPCFHQVKSALPVLTCLIHSNDEEVLSNACRAFSYLSDGTNDKIQVVIEEGVCGRLVELLMHPSLSVLKPALHTIGNITSVDDSIISHQALMCLSKLLTNGYRKSIKKEACRTISNITSRNNQQIHAVIEANIVVPLVHLLQNAETLDIKGEAARAISNVTSRGTDDQINFFVSQGCFKPLGDLLNCRNPSIVKVCLEGLENILKIGGAARAISNVISRRMHEHIKFLASQGCIKPLCDLLVCRDPRIVKVCLEGLENILKVGEDDKSTGTSGGVNLYAQMIGDARGREKIEYLLNYFYDDEICEKAQKVSGKCGFE